METIFGVEHDVSVAQECARAVLIFLYGLALLRLSGRRTFADWSALDVLISIVIGSNLSRALTGSVPLAGTLGASAVLVGLHVLLAHGVARYKSLSAVIEGKPIELGKGGFVDAQKRRRHMFPKAISWRHCGRRELRMCAELNASSSKLVARLPS